MDIIYARGEATALEVAGGLPDPPSYSSVRTLLAILEEKGHLKHTKKGARFLYQPTRPRRQVARSALKRVVETFFGGSTPQAMAALIEEADSRLSPEELQELARLIDRAKKEGK